jgi:hypothetical protein
MVDLERKLSNFQPSTASASFLDSIPVKEERMASIETKVAKVDPIEETATKLAGYLATLFDVLEKAVQM